MKRKEKYDWTCTGNPKTGIRHPTVRNKTQKCRLCGKEYKLSHESSILRFRVDSFINYLLLHKIFFGFSCLLFIILLFGVRACSSPNYKPRQLRYSYSPNLRQFQIHEKSFNQFVSSKVTDFSIDLIKPLEVSGSENLLEDALKSHRLDAVFTQKKFHKSNSLKYKKIATDRFYIIRKKDDYSENIELNEFINTYFSSGDSSDRPNIFLLKKSDYNILENSYLNNIKSSENYIEYTSFEELKSALIENPRSIAIVHSSYILIQNSDIESINFKQNSQSEFNLEYDLYLAYRFDDNEIKNYLTLINSKLGKQCLKNMGFMIKADISLTGNSKVCANA